MDKRSTLKDIAEEAGVSAVTVHKAIYGKAGISKKTREKVLKIAEKMNYSVNAAASSLKRDVRNIAVIFPVLEDSLNYFSRKLWEGAHEAERELMDFRVSLVPYPCGGTWQSQVEVLKEIIHRSDVDGVVIYCWDDTKLNECFELLKQKSVPVVTVNSDAVNSCRVGTVTAPAERMGRLAAEYLCQVVPPNGRLIIFSGNRMMKNIRENSFGFFSYVQKFYPGLSVLEFNEFTTVEKAQADFEESLKAFHDIVGVYSNSARNNIPMCEVIKRLGLVGKLKILASDVYEEFAPYIEEGVVQATTWQDPKLQAKKALMMLYEYLTVQKIENEHETVKIGIVFRNNFRDYL